MTDRSNWITQKLTRDEHRREVDLSRSTTPQERWAMMWELATNACAFKGDPVDERLPRHIVRVIRREG